MSNAYAKIMIIKTLWGDGMPICHHCHKVVNASALHFHHIESDSKALNPSQAIRKSYAKGLEECAKCEPLCKECHMLYHNTYGKHATMQDYIEFQVYSR